MNILLKQGKLKPLLLISTAGILASLAIYSYKDNHSVGIANSYPYSFTQSSPDRVMGNLEDEINFYQEKIRHNPQDGLERAALAKAYLKMARTTGDVNWYLLAEQSARQSLANLPFDNQGAILVLAHIAEAKHDFRGTISLAQQVLQSEPDSENALALLVSANLAMGNLNEANLAAHNLVSKIPALNSFTLRALVYTAQGENTSALADFKQALALEEPGEEIGSAKTRTFLGRFYSSQGQYVLARQLYQEALSIVPDFPFTLVNLAELEVKEGNYSAAENIYTQLSNTANSAETFDHLALEGLAQVKLLQGNKSAAEALWEQAEHEFRHHHEIDSFGHHHHKIDSFGHRRELAHLLLARGNSADLPEALALMKAEANIRRDAETLNTLAWIFHKLGRNDEAQKVFQEALGQGVKNAEIFYRAGLVEKALGNDSQANKYFEQAKQTDNNWFNRLSLEVK